jgi:hypothetical protein
MASFAKLNSNNIVETVISINNTVITDSNEIEQEQLGVDFINQLYNTNNTWKQTSYNTNAGLHSLGGIPFRKNHAGIGFQYDLQRDAFIAPKPYNSWVLNEETCIWNAPVAMPTAQLEENQYYSWNESTLSWDLVTK